MSPAVSIVAFCRQRKECYHGSVEAAMLESYFNRFGARVRAREHVVRTSERTSIMKKTVLVYNGFMLVYITSDAYSRKQRFLILPQLRELDGFYVHCSAGTHFYSPMMKP